MAQPRIEQVTYVLPIKVATPATDELTGYLRRIAALVPVIVVDGSTPAVFAAHDRQWAGFLSHLPVRGATVNGKVAGLVYGVAAARTSLVVVADDDVRYDEASLAEVVARLDRAAVVVPQNYFAPLPWHARWDSARSLLNRALGHDYAGTAGLRRDALLGTHGYCGAVLFENLEMLRTLAAHGHEVLRADDIYVARRPPDVRHFAGQRVRQAFDSAAQPGRLLLELAGLPGLALAAAYDPRLLPLAALAVMGMAEVGRRRAGGAEVFDRSLPLWAPCWVLERSICAWLALASRPRGGVRYAGQRLHTSAHPVRRLTGPGCPEASCRCDTALRPLSVREAA